MSAADAVSVLRSIFDECEGMIEIRPLPPGRHRIEFFTSPRKAALYARSLNGKVDVYFGAGTRHTTSGTKEAVQFVPGVWADCDSEASVAKLAMFTFKPTLEIETSPGRLHAWWLFKEPVLIEGEGTIASVEGVLRGIAAILESDPAVAEVARIMRVPGTLNVKRKAPCRLIRNDGPRYDLADFTEAGIYREPKTTSGNGSVPGRLDTSAVLAGVPDGQRDQDLFRLACKLRRADVPQDTAERLVLEAASKCSPPFPTDEARTKVAGAYRRYPAAAPKPESDENRPPGQPDDPPVESWPDPPAEAAFHGLLGEIVHAVEAHTEADPIGIQGQLLVGLGNMIGGGPYFRVEGTQHHARENLVIVGRTSAARKGTSWGQARRPLAAVDEVWERDRILGGLSSGEGLIHAVRDRREERRPVMEKGRCVDYTTVEVDAGVDDKRLLCVETEFSRPLKVLNREGSTLSEIVRQAWDGPNLRVMTKSAAVATGAHVSVIAHITAEELVRRLEDTEAASGFGNRFIWLAVKRARLLPDGGDLDAAHLAPLIMRLSQAVSEARRTGEMKRDDQARDLWREVYPALSTGRPGLLGAMLSRAEAHVLRLSMIYALADSSPMIRRPHLEAALALWDYSASSAAFIFGNKLGDPTADELLLALRAAPTGRMSRTEIREHFSGNKSAAEITRALGVLVRQNLARSETEKHDGPGRPTEWWYPVKPGEV